MNVLQIELCFPEEALVYDYRLDDAGISNFKDDDEDEETKVNRLCLIRHIFYTNNTIRYIFAFHAIIPLPVL